MSVYHVEDVIGENEVEIKWPSLGSTSIEATESFIKDLQNAVKYAKSIRLK